MKIIKTANGKSKVRMSKAEWLKMGQNAGWQSAEEMSQNMKDYYATTQNTNPDEASFAVDIRGNRKAIPASARGSISKTVNGLGSYTDDLSSYIDSLFNNLRANGLIALQEDGTPWSGMIGSQGECGSDKANNQPAIAIDLGVNTENGYLLANSKLIMTICTMPSGKLEIVAYLS